MSLLLPPENIYVAQNSLVPSNVEQEENALVPSNVEQEDSDAELERIFGDGFKES